MVNIYRLIQTVGTNTFITYFDDFQKKTVEELIELFAQRNEGWTWASRETKAITGKRIFKERLEIEALMIILEADFRRIPRGAEIEEKAKTIARKYGIYR
jgi:hypothetical protein